MKYSYNPEDVSAETKAFLKKRSSKTSTEQEARTKNKGYAIIYSMVKGKLEQKHALYMWTELYDKGFLDGRRSVIGTIAAITYVNQKMYSPNVDMNSILTQANSLRGETDKLTADDIERIATDILNKLNITYKENQPLYILDTMWPKFGFASVNKDIKNTSERILTNTKAPERSNMRGWVATVVWYSAKKRHNYNLDQGFAAGVAGLGRDVIINNNKYLESQPFIKNNLVNTPHAKYNKTCVECGGVLIYAPEYGLGSSGADPTSTTPVAEVYHGERVCSKCGLVQ